MPVEMSPKLLREFSAAHQPLIHVLVRARRLRSAVRLVNRKLSGPASQSRQQQPAVSAQLEATAETFREHGWSFVDPYFEPPFFSEVQRGWPPRHFFAPMHNVLKSYDFGFRWHRDRAADGGELERFPALAATYAMLRSTEFARRIAAFCGDGIARSCFSLTSTWASARSALIPHRDKVAHDPTGESFINIVIFVDGNGRAPHGGGTCIIEDSEYERIIFEPTNLTNTALVYRSCAPFFHGFRPMARGTFRWTINAQYCDPAWKNVRGESD